MFKGDRDVQVFGKKCQMDGTVGLCSSLDFFLCFWDHTEKYQLVRALAPFFVVQRIYANPPLPPWTLLHILLQQGATESLTPFITKCFSAQDYSTSGGPFASSYSILAYGAATAPLSSA